MIYRLLGMVSLAIGGIFALVAFLVLLPFLNNFNYSLLILTAVFAVLAWVFLAIGWQLFHPPEEPAANPDRRPEQEPEASEEPPAGDAEPEPPSAAAGSRSSERPDAEPPADRRYGPAEAAERPAPSRRGPG
jgi:hypothetical protein